MATPKVLRREQEPACEKLETWALTELRQLENNEMIKAAEKDIEEMVKYFKPRWTKVSSHRKRRMSSSRERFHFVTGSRLETANGVTGANSVMKRMNKLNKRTLLIC